MPSRTRDEHGSDGGAGADVKTALPDLVESYIYKPEVADKPKPPALEKAGATYHAEVLRVLGCLHHLTAAALGLPRDFFDPYYAPFGGVSLLLATIRRSRWRHRRRRRCGMASTLTTRASRFCTRTSLTLATWTRADSRSD